MRTIIGSEKFEGQPLRQGILYTGSMPIPFSGQIQFQVFGSAVFNGCKVRDTTIKVYADQAKISLSKDASVVFYQVPSTKETPGGFEPVPDLPDYGDEALQSIQQMVQETLQRLGYEAPGRDSAAQPGFDDIDQDDEFSEWEGPELDNFSLLADPLEPVQNENENDEDQEQQSEVDPATDDSPEEEQKGTS